MIIRDFLKSYAKNDDNYRETHHLIFDMEGNPIQISNTPPQRSDRQKLADFCPKFFLQAAANNDKEILHCAETIKNYCHRRESLDPIFTIFDKTIKIIRSQEDQESPCSLDLLLHAPLLVPLALEEDTEPMSIPFTSQAIQDYMYYSNRRSSFFHGEARNRLDNIFPAISVAHFVGDEDLIHRLVKLGALNTSLAFFPALRTLLDHYSPELLMTMQDAIAERMNIDIPNTNLVQYFNHLATFLGPEKCSCIYKVSLSHRPISLELLTVIAQQFPQLQHLDLSYAKKPIDFIIPEDVRNLFRQITETVDNTS